MSVIFSRDLVKEATEQCRVADIAVVVWRQCRRWLAEVLACSLPSDRFRSILLCPLISITFFLLLHLQYAISYQYAIIIMVTYLSSFEILDKRINLVLTMFERQYRVKSSSSVALALQTLIVMPQIM